MAIANASMLDEATAAAEAMTLARRSVKSKSDTHRRRRRRHPQTIEVLRTRAEPLGLDGRARQLGRGMGTPDRRRRLLRRARAVAGDERPAARHARRRAAHPRARRRLHRRRRPARADAASRRPASSAPTSPAARRSASACRWAAAARTPPTSPAATSTSAACPADSSASASTRTAHRPTASRCRRASSTSGARRRPRNICTAQVLPAVVASMYAVYHGPDGLKRIAERVAAYTAMLAEGLRRSAGRCAARAPSTRSRSTPAPPPPRLFDARRRRRHEPAPLPRVGRHDARHRPRRDDDARRHRALWRVFAQRAQALPDVAAFERGIAPLIPEALRRSVAVPDPSGLQPPPQRDRDAALPARPRRQGPRARPLDDPARLVHDEAERDERDDPDHLARVRAASIRSRPPTSAPATRRCARSSRRGSARRPAMPASACSRTPARRANTPACSRSAPGTRRAAKRRGRSA